MSLVLPDVEEASERLRQRKALIGVRIARLIWLCARLGRPSRRVLFHPESPRKSTLARRLCYVRGDRIVLDPDSDWDVALYWEDATLRSPAPGLPEIVALGPCVNARCTDISKRLSERVFEESFGYPLAVDPTTHVGPCHRKSNENGLHDGVVIDCPIDPDEVDPACVYEKLVDGRPPGCDGYIEELRITVIGDRIPKVFRRRWGVGETPMRGKSRRAVPPNEVMSRDEIDRIVAYCRGLGLDFADLDAMRDRADGRLYVFDGNSTPVAHWRRTPLWEQVATLIELAEVFDEVFPSKAGARA